MGSPKIQINDLAALERLFGGNTEFEIEFRQSAVAAFSKKHLKGIAETKYFQQVLKELKQEILYNIKNEFRDVLMKEVGFIQENVDRVQVYYSAAIKKGIREHVRAEMAGALQKEMKKVLGDLVKDVSNPTMQKAIEEAVIDKTLKALGKKK